MIFLQVLWLYLPMGFANMAPVFAQRIPILGLPIDGGKKIGGKFIFGEHKTWRGIIAAVILGTVIFLFQQYLSSRHLLSSWQILDYSKTSWLAGVAISFGAIFGDLLESFLKRRVGVESGKPWVPYDQIDYILGAVIFLLPWYVPSWPVFILLLIYGAALTSIFHYIGYYLGVRKQKI